MVRLGGSSTIGVGSSIGGGGTDDVEVDTVITCTQILKLHPNQTMELKQYISQQQEQTIVHPTSSNNNNNNNFGTIFVCQTYWLAVIASNPKSAAKGFCLTRYVLLMCFFIQDLYLRICCFP
jgi:hypothetical protein